MSLHSWSSHMAGAVTKLVNPSETQIWRPLSNCYQIVLHDPSQPWLVTTREKINPVSTGSSRCCNAFCSISRITGIYFTWGLPGFFPACLCYPRKWTVNSKAVVALLLFILCKTSVTIQESWTKFFQHSNALAWMLNLVAEYLCRNSRVFQNPEQFITWTDWLHMYGTVVTDSQQTFLLCLQFTLYRIHLAKLLSSQVDEI